MKGIRGRNYPATVAALLQIQRKLIQKKKTVMQNKSKLHIIYLYLNTNIRYISYTNRITFQKTSKMYSPNGQRNMNDMIWLWLCLKNNSKSPNHVSKVQNCMWPWAIPKLAFTACLGGKASWKTATGETGWKSIPILWCKSRKKKSSTP